MQAVLIHAGNVLVAAITGNFRWVSDQTLMSDQLVRCRAVAAVTDNTAHLAVDILDKFSIVHEDLLPYLQRRQLPGSAFT